MRTQIDTSERVINNFTLVYNSNEMVILEIKDKDALSIAKHPYLSSDYKYITVSKGIKNMLTVTKENGTTTSNYIQNLNFERLNISTISDLLEFKVLEAILKYGIPIGLKTVYMPTSFKLCFNPTYKLWQTYISVKNSFSSQLYFFDKSIVTLENAINELENIFSFNAINLKKEASSTGIDVVYFDAKYV